MTETKLLDTDNLNTDSSTALDAPSEAELKIVEEMMQAGVMYGHKKTKTNPKFKTYIHTTRNKVEIIDVALTLPAIEKAAAFMKEQIKNGKTILLVAVQPAAREAMDGLAKKINMPYVKNHWIGGLMTNFKVLSQRLEYFKKTREGMEKGKFEKHTKKERVVINRNIGKMREMFEGIEDLTKLPDVLFIIDTNLKEHTTALREAKIINIPVVAIIDSDDDPTTINFSIPANDHAKSSIEWVVNKIIENLSAEGGKD